MKGVNGDDNESDREYSWKECSRRRNYLCPLGEDVITVRASWLEGPYRVEKVASVGRLASNYSWLAPQSCRRLHTCGGATLASRLGSSP